MTCNNFEYKSFKQSIEEVYSLSGFRPENYAPFFAEKIYEKNVEKLVNFSECQDNIPKIIHFIWLGGELPLYLSFCINSWKKFHPEWQFILWDDQKVASFNIKNRILYDCVKNIGCKVDILRLEILQQMGGVYVDTDMFCLKSIDSLIKMEYFHSTEANGYPVVNNGVIGCVPNNHIINDMILELSNVPIDRTNLANLGNYEILKIAGPIFITNFFIKKITENNLYFGENEIILPPSYFSPFSEPHCGDFWSGRLPLYRVIEKHSLKESFAIHLSNNSWKPFVQRNGRLLEMLKKRKLVFTKSKNISDILRSKNKYGQTPLLLATINNWQLELEELLRSSANYNDVDKKGLSVLDYAKKNKNYNFFKPYII